MEAKRLHQIRIARIARDAELSHGSPYALTNIYAIDCEGEAVKFGVARRPKRRLDNLQVSNFRRLSLAGVVVAHRDCEKLIHDLLAPHRIRGEWFSYSDDTNRMVELMRAENVDFFESLKRFREV